MNHNWPNTLSSYASVSGVLSGFSITFIVFILGKETANSLLIVGLSWGNLAALTLGAASVLFIAALQYFLTAKEYDLWDLSDNHIKSLSDDYQKEGKATWKQIAEGSLEACYKYESRGRWLYNWAIVVLFLGLFFAIGPFSLLVATIVAALGVGFEGIQIFQHHLVETPAPGSTTPPANSPAFDVQATSSILSLYSSQLTSHAALVIATLVALVSLLQASNLLGLSRWHLALSVASLLSLTTYLGIRLIVYGGLTRAITHGTKQDVDDFTRSNSERVVKLLQHAVVNEYAIFFLNNRSKLRRLYSIRRTEVRALLAIVWVTVATIILYTPG